MLLQERRQNTWHRFLTNQNRTALLLFDRGTSDCQGDNHSELPDGPFPRILSRRCWLESDQWPLREHGDSPEDRRQTLFFRLFSRDSLNPRLSKARDRLSSVQAFSLRDSSREPLHGIVREQRLRF